MKKLKKLLFIFYFLLFTSNLYTQFEDTGCGARASGMANAYTADASGPEAIYYNPAGISLAMRSEFLSSYSRLFWGLTDGSLLGKGFIALIVPFKERYGIGAGWQNFMLAKYYSEDTFYLSFARRVREKISLGMNFKILKKVYVSTEYTEKSVNLETGEVINSRNPVFIDGYERINYTLDTGMIWMINPSNRLALMLRNITSPDMALSRNDTDRVGIDLKVGYKFTNNRITTLIDIGYSGNDINFYSGVEGWMLNDIVALRGGLGLGSREYRNFTIGASVKNAGVFQFDYAFNYPLAGIKGTYGTHKLSLTVSFGELVKREVKIIEEDHLKADKLFESGNDAFNRGKYSKAQGFFRRAYKINFELIKAKKMISKSSKMKKEKDNIIKNTRKLYLIGVSALNKNDFITALKKFGEVISIDDRGWNELKEISRKAKGRIAELEEEKIKYIEILFAKTDIYYRDRKYEKMLKILNEILILDSENKTTVKKIKQVQEELIKLHYFAGMGYYIEGKYNKAIKKFNKVLEIDENHTSSLFMIKKIKVEEEK